MLSDLVADAWERTAGVGLNAPFGARCFLTDSADVAYRPALVEVLMHLLALGAL